MLWTAEFSAPFLLDYMFVPVVFEMICKFQNHLFYFPILHFGLPISLRVIGSGLDYFDFEGQKQCRSEFFHEYKVAVRDIFFRKS